MKIKRKREREAVNFESFLLAAQFKELVDEARRSSTRLKEVESFAFNFSLLTTWEGIEFPACAAQSSAGCP